jgi:hypothetical protein
MAKPNCLLLGYLCSSHPYSCFVLVASGDNHLQPLGDCDNYCDLSPWQMEWLVQKGWIDSDTKMAFWSKGEEMKRVLIITADVNDADYVTQEILIKSDEQLAKLKKILEVVKTKSGNYAHNWPNSEYSSTSVAEVYEGLLTEDEIEWFEQFLPHGEFGIHTIVNAKLLYVEKEEHLLEWRK